VRAIADAAAGKKWNISRCAGVVLSLGLLTRRDRPAKIFRAPAARVSRQPARGKCGGETERRSDMKTLIEFGAAPGRMGAVCGRGVPIAAWAACAALLWVAASGPWASRASGQTVADYVRSAQQQTQMATDRQRALSFSEQQIYANWLSRQQSGRTGRWYVRQRSWVPRSGSPVQSYAAPAAEISAPSTADRQTAVVINNPTSYAIACQVRYGQSGSWEQVEIPANRGWWGAVPYDSRFGASPFYIRYNRGLDHACAEQYYMLRGRDTLAGQTGIGKQYWFRMEPDGKHVELKLDWRED